MARILIDPQAIQGDDTVVVRGPEAKHLLRVLRMREGSTLTAFDGEGSEWPATVTLASATTATLTLGAKTTTNRETPVDVTFAMGIPKGETLDAVVRSVTELGARRIVPLLTERSVPDTLSDHKLTRLRRINDDACKQCGRNEPPEVTAATTLVDFLASVQAQERWIFGLAATDPVPPATETVSSAALLIGPEGGWSPEEIAAAQDAGFFAVTLGPRVLRVHTAAIAALTAYLISRGDMA